MDQVKATCVCEGGGLWAALRDDFDRYVFLIQRDENMAGPLTPFLVGLLSQGLWATTAYRLSHYVRFRFRSLLLEVLSFIFQRIVVALTGIQIDRRAHIGPGLWIAHNGCIVIGPARIGKNCGIFQGVTLGQSASTLDRPSSPGVPILGDRVWVGPGAVIAGEVTVGNDASVGANSLLVRDAPPRGVMLGVPARMVSRQGSFTQIRYRDMDTDDERIAALADLEAAPDRYDGRSLAPDGRLSAGPAQDVLDPERMVGPRRVLRVGTAGAVPTRPEFGVRQG